MKRRLALALLLMWVLPALACNLPRRKTPVLEWLPAYTATPAGLGGEGSTMPESLAPTVEPTPLDGELHGWEFTGLSPQTEFSEETASGALVQIETGRMGYRTQPGDMLVSLAGRFGVEVDKIHASQEMPAESFLPAGTALEIEMESMQALSPAALLPDSEIVYGPSSVGFSVADYIGEAGGFLAAYTEEVDQETLNGARIVERVALETSTNPRLLLAFLEYRSGWVLGQPRAGVNPVFPIGFGSEAYRGLYDELILTARMLSQGLYGWRSGKLTQVEFPLGGSARIHPQVNAGTAAVTVLVSKLYKQEKFAPALYGPQGFVAFYIWMFGDPWVRASVVEPVFGQDFLDTMPELELPFLPGEFWNLTGGPHIAWGSASPPGAVDFAPAGERSGCYISARWATASAAGVVVRSERGALLLDLDGDGLEQTGWVLLYLHLADEGRATVGTQVQVGDPLGHPSCEGGVATGTHVHLSRKYNGEWIGAGPETPFVLSGWRVMPGDKPYLGELVHPDGSVVSAKSDGSRTSLISR